MDNKSPFSIDYIKPSKTILEKEKDTHVFRTKILQDDIIREIEENFKPKKPIRTIIKAKII